MSQHPACRHETIARNGVASVQRCVSCGCLSLHVGPVTLRLDEASLEGLWAVTGEACASVHAEQLRTVRPTLVRGST